jgi:bifunctional non-homologous end joining protein LigD
MKPPRVPDDPLDWRPQRPLVTRVAVIVKEPLVEPLWSGTRVIAHVDPEGAHAVRLIDELGLDLAPEEPALSTAIAAALLAQDAIIDGILTDQATRSGEGAAIVTQAHISIMDSLMSREPGVAIRRPDTDEMVTDEAFVAFDLLRIDGQSLLDVPLLERKRILESVIDQGPRVRVAVFCRPPADPWVASWQSAGLRGAMLKASNSRYIPGDRTPEWRTLTRIAARR